MRCKYQMTSQIALGGEDLCNGASDEERGHELCLQMQSFGTHKLPLNARYLITMRSESCPASGAPSVFIAIRELCAGAYGALIYQRWVIFLTDLIYSTIAFQF